VREAQRLGLPVIALVDTNCDPDEAQYVIPGNDDAIRSCSLITRAIADAIEAGRQRVTRGEMAGARNGDRAPEAPTGDSEPAGSTDEAGAEPAPAADDAPVPVDDEVAAAPEYEVQSQGERAVEAPGSPANGGDQERGR